MNTNNFPDLLTIEDIAKYLQVTKIQAKKILENSGIPLIKFDEKIIRVKKDIFMSYIDSISNN